MEHISVPGTQRQDPPPGLVLALELIGAELLPAVGGKAANLGELLRTGLPVPPGFCLTTQAYRHAMREVVARCIFGVDRNPMAIELARTALVGMDGGSMPWERCWCASCCSGAAMAYWNSARSWPAFT